MSIEVRDIHKSFGNFTALGGVSLDFATGELVALLGPSGCGKTTLLRIIAGLETADRGGVVLGGVDASATDVRARQVGFVFQHYALFGHMTVFENVAFGLRVRARKRRPSEAQIRRKVGDLLALVQLEGLAARLPAEISGGQRQRVALARALAVEPRVLLLDEPFGALDAQVRKELRRWLRTLHDELHITSLFVTHDQEEALEVADRIVLMNRGQVEQIGTPSEVYEAPATSFAHGFLGVSNRFEGTAGSPEGFARPHEVDVFLQPVERATEALVGRVLGFGAASRIELRGTDGAHYEVELARERAEALGVAGGQRVWLRPQRLSVFAGDDTKADPRAATRAATRAADEPA